MIEVRVNAKAARKLAAWTGARGPRVTLRYSDGQLSLAEAGFQFLEPKRRVPGAGPAGATMSTIGKRLTVDQYDLMVANGILPEATYFELIEGRIVEKCRMTPAGTCRGRDAAANC